MNNTHKVLMEIQNNEGDPPDKVEVLASEISMHRLWNKPGIPGLVADVELRVDGEIQSYENVISFDMAVLDCD